MVVFGLVTAFVASGIAPAEKMILMQEVQGLIAEFDRVKSQAISSGQKVTFYADAEGGTPGDGYYAAMLLPADSTLASAPLSMRYDINPILVYGTGDAQYGPMGDSVDPSTPIPFAAVSCDAYGVCDMGSTIVATYYLQVAGNDSRVAAVTLSSAGAMQYFLYNSANGSWE